MFFEALNCEKYSLVFIFYVSCISFPVRVLSLCKSNCKKNMELPEDPMILYSFINMKLRDYYSSLDELCEDMQIDKTSLLQKLLAVGFEYSEEYNKFW